MLMIGNCGQASKKRLAANSITFPKNVDTQIQGVVNWAPIQPRALEPKTELIVANRD